MDKKSCRKNITRSEKHGVQTREMTESDLPIFQQLRLDPINNKPDLGLDELQLRWKMLHKFGLTGFLAFYKEKPVGGIMVSNFNNYLNELSIVRSTLDQKEKLYSQDLLKWTIIKWAKSKNLKYFDLSGINPNPLTDKEKGIFRYKQKWGGELIKYNTIKK